MSTPKSRARWLRGVLVAASSTVVTVGAHAAAGGRVPQGAPLLLSILIGLTVGALAAGLSFDDRRARVLGTVGALALAQGLGHLTLSVAAGHHHAARPSSSMLVYHAVAAVLLGALINATEYLYVVCASVLCWLRLFASRLPRPLTRASSFISDVVAQSVLRCAGLGMRAPPHAAQTA